jgi:uncharacterized protein
MLKILAFCDVHGDADALTALKRKARKSDLVICAGDVSIFEHRILPLMKQIDRLGKPVFIVHGNHEEPEVISEICRKLKNVRMLHRKAISDNRFPGYVFVGYGGEGFSHSSPDFERFAARILPKLRKLKAKLILVTHQPPYRTKLDYIWDHHGNRSYLNFIKKAKPVLAISGHLHENEGKKDRIAKTMLINPGPKGEILKIN